jgi:hypothetical protein
LKLKIGRPSQYCKETTPAFVGYLAQEGKTEDEIAERLHVSRQTLFSWKQKYPEFLDACRLSKEEADSLVQLSLYQKAIGMKGANGDVGACRYWLSHRQPAIWREQLENKITGDITVNRTEKVVSSIKDIQDQYADAGRSAVSPTDSTGE